MLAPSAIFVTVNLVYLGVARVRQKLMDIVLIPGAVALGTLTLSYVLIPPLDLLGPAVAWLVSNGRGGYRCATQISEISQVEGGFRSLIDDANLLGPIWS